MRRVIRLLSVSHASSRYVAEDPGALSVISAGPSGWKGVDFRRSMEAILSDPTLTSRSDYNDTYAIERPQSGSLRTAILRLRRRFWMAVVASDLAGDASLEECIGVMSDLADACLSAAWRELLAPVHVAVIGLGKLGARELNYASDVDVVFVSPDGQPSGEADPAVRSYVRFVGGELASERIWLVDADLRPEGRAGALVRTVASYARYWDDWAEPWEIQALIKARPVCGPNELSSQFLEEATRRLWSDKLGPEAIREIRRLKRRSETEAASRSKGFDIKRSAGGIRDLEMAVQLLQLIHGRHDPELRKASTLDAVAALEEGGYVSSGDAEEMRRAYVFLRNVEHRLQVVDDRPRYDLPADPRIRRIIARSLGFSDSATETAEEAFSESFVSVTATVRNLHQKLFFRPLLERLAEVPSGEGVTLRLAEDRLSALGFGDTRQAEAGVAELTRGISRRSRLMAQLLPLALEWLSESPSPQRGLTRLRALVDAVGDSAVLVSTFRDNPVALQRLCTVLGTSKAVSDALLRHPEHLQALADDSAILRVKDREALLDEAESFTSWRGEHGERIDGLLRFSRREFLRVATRDIFVKRKEEAEAVGKELAAVAEAVIRVATRAVLEDEKMSDVPFAVVGLGSFGACEMAYSSDADVMFLYSYEGVSSTRAKDELQERAIRVASRLVRELEGIGSLGRGVKIDADLRPEGRAGPLARSIEATLTYYRRWAQTWEYQSLSKARHVAGDESLTQAFISGTAEHTWPEHLPAERVREIRLMKARVERERLPKGHKGRMHVKLGPGGMSDVQFLTELFCLRHGHAHPELRTGSTLERLRAMARLGLLPHEEAERLEEAYLFCASVRNRLFLVKGVQQDWIPEDLDEVRVLAESMGYVGRPRGRLLDDYRRLTRRSRAVFEQLFYN